MSNEDDRMDAMTELANRARDEGTEGLYHDKLKTAVAVLLQDAGSSPTKLQGLYSAMMHYAVMIAYGSVGTAGDIFVRTSEDVANASAAIWDQACRNGESLLQQLQASGQTSTELEQKVKLAPSNPKMRIDLPVKLPPAAGKPESVQEILARLNSGGSGSNN